jgi:NAD(P)-dependent dehydrogenase (short-subunit alcohol dehydrogenase family)
MTMDAATYSFADKVAIVTGATSGIGKATAQALARAGARVVVSGINEALGSRVVEEITRDDGTAVFIRADVSRREDVEHLVSETVRQFGRLDIAFNNAGIEGDTALTADWTEECWLHVLDVNLTGVWRCMKAEIPAMLSNGGGVIVNCSSVAGLVGFAGSAAYVASKHGIIGLTRTAALEYAPMGIRINAICPGVIDTPMVRRVIHDDPEQARQILALEPIGRMGNPEEIAAAVLWLCSDAATFVIGHPLVVDGGLVAR